MVSIDLDVSLIFQIINFLIVIAVLNYTLYRPIRGILRQRKEKVEGHEAEIARLDASAKDKAEEMEALLAEARKDGYARKETIKGEGLDNEKAILAEANAKAEAAAEKIRAQVSGEIKAAHAQLSAQIETFGRDLAQKILGRSLA